MRQKEILFFGAKGVINHFGRDLVSWIRETLSQHFKSVGEVNVISLGLHAVKLPNFRFFPVLWTKPNKMSGKRQEIQHFCYISLHNSINDSLILRFQSQFSLQKLEIHLNFTILNFTTLMIYQTDSKILSFKWTTNFVRRNHKTFFSRWKQFNVSFSRSCHHHL